MIERPSPTMNTGSASARLGPALRLTSEAILRPLSARPKSNANMRTELSKNTVSVTFFSPLARSLKYSGRSYPRSAFHCWIAAAVTRLPPSCSRAMSSGEFSWKNSRNVARLIPARTAMP